MFIISSCYINIRENSIQSSFQVIDELNSYDRTFFPRFGDWDYWFPRPISGIDASSVFKVSAFDLLMKYKGFICNQYKHILICLF